MTNPVTRIALSGTQTVIKALTQKGTSFNATIPGKTLRELAVFTGEKSSPVGAALKEAGKLTYNLEGTGKAVKAGVNLVDKKGKPIYQIAGKVDGGFLGQIIKSFQEQSAKQIAMLQQSAKQATANLKKMPKTKTMDLNSKEANKNINIEELAKKFKK